MTFTDDQIAEIRYAVERCQAHDGPGLDHYEFRLACIELYVTIFDMLNDGDG